MIAGLCALLIGKRARADTPTLQWDQPIACVTDGDGKVVRVQCHELPGGGRRCLVAPNEQTPSGDELQQVQPCAQLLDVHDLAELSTKDTEVVTAIAEAPPGYARAENGRAYQVQFDLLDRLYFGLAWAPTFQRHPSSIETAPGLPFARAQVEIGIEASLLSPGGRSRHDLRFLVGSATLSDFELRGTLFSYDYQHLHVRPSFWLTSFLGEPKVYPISMPFGWGVRVLTLLDRPASNREVVDSEVLEMHLAWNPWQSDEMYSHLRFEVGAGLGEFWDKRGKVTRDFGGGAWYAGPTAAIRARTSLGKGGLHYAFVDMEYSRPRHLQGPRAGTWFNRLSTTIAYEGILLAIDDQPISLRIAASGSSRDDLLTGSNNVELKVLTGLRFSLWAPPRRFEPMAPVEDP